MPWVNLESAIGFDTAVLFSFSGAANMFPGQFDPNHVEHPGLKV